MDVLDHWRNRWIIFLLYMCILTLLFSFMLRQHDSWNSLMDGPLPTSSIQIFRHNFPIMMLFGIPYIGIPVALLSLGTNALFIAISMTSVGIMQTLLLLVHLPLELFALVGLIRCDKKTYLRRLLLCSFFLWISALIEIRLV